MNVRLHLIGLFMGIAMAGNAAEFSVPASIEGLIENGRFQESIKQLGDLAGQAKGDDERAFYQWEAERLRRIKLDYTLDRNDLLRQLKSRIQNVNRVQFDEWEADGRFDVRVIDGETRFLSSSVSNLLFRYPDIRKRHPVDLKMSLSSFLKEIAYADANLDPCDDSLLYAQRYTNRMSVMVDADAVAAGETVRCWMPYPKENEFQQEVRLLASTPAPLSISNSEVPHRGVYLEQPAKAGLPTTFCIEYTYLSVARLDEVDPGRVTGKIPAEIEPFLQETRHVQFLPQMKNALDEIIGDETNPYLKAQAIYLWMAREFRYSYAREYSTIRNISRYSFERKYGDCGQLALAYITLCRMAGIPARWESGWMMYPALTNLHDWAVIYLDPYGWVPVDVNMGVEANHTWDSITPDEKDAMIAFYFGKMDPYRMVVNSCHGGEFEPSKKHPRSDTVDFQRGEVETDQGNLYYDQFSYQMDVLSRHGVPME